MADYQREKRLVGFGYPGLKGLTSLSNCVHVGGIEWSRRGPEFGSDFPTKLATRRPDFHAWFHVFDFLIRNFNVGTSCTESHWRYQREVRECTLMRDGISLLISWFNLTASSLLEMLTRDDITLQFRNVYIWFGFVAVTLLLINKTKKRYRRNWSIIHACLSTKSIVQIPRYTRRNWKFHLKLKKKMKREKEIL